MKTLLTLGILGCIAISSHLLAALPRLPVIIPDSSWRVTNEPGVHAHTRIRILDTRKATAMSLGQANTPSTVRSAYSLPSTGGTGAIAIVDAYHFPTAEHDFNTFANQYGLPAETSQNATSGKNHIFQVVYATGRKPSSGGSYIASWNLEEALDIEWAHAIAPSAKIYLVEAASDSMNDLLYAVEVAASLTSVHQVSMSWGGDEVYDEADFDYIFSTPGVSFFAAGGDESDELEYPSSSPNVVSVGGTTLNLDSYGNLLSETGWDDTGCGISLYEPRPSYQDPIASLVGNYRGANDVSFLADPGTGVNVYDSTLLYGEKGWWIVGGTSLSTPCWAGVANLGTATYGVFTTPQVELVRLYSNLGNGSVFRDITQGQAGSVGCQVGWDQPTGLGSPVTVLAK